MMAGYSVYHAGFPDTLSLKPETLAQVFVETMGVRQRYGFRRFMLYLRPDLIHMDRAEKPVIHYSPEAKELNALLRERPELAAVQPGIEIVPKETGKGGSIREFSSNGCVTGADPRDATAALGGQIVNRHVETAVVFIEAWKRVKRLSAPPPLK
jgi:creatinine amidohydrolase/Fe(II)-dependent formamide hydrolase-like protein